MIKNQEATKIGNFALFTSLALLTILAGVGGWIIGNNFDFFIENNFSKGTDNFIIERKNVTRLPPIISNLMSPEGGRIRLESALVTETDQEMSSKLVAEISNDFLAYLRQNTISQIKGGMGLMYLREDLLERAAIRSGGKVVQILLSGLVIDR